MKTAGVVIDFYDDHSGKILKSVFPDPTVLPEQVKTAHILNGDEHNVLRDEAYALILVNEGHVLRKFACVDSGNLMISMHYLEKTAGSLTDEAIGTAASNMLAFCDEYGVEPTDYVKLAAKAYGKGPANGMSRERDSMKQPVAGDDSEWAQRTNINSVSGNSESGKVLATTAKLKTAAVNVTGKSPITTFTKKASSRYALGTKYPLDSFADVQKAVTYFQDNWKEMDPEDRKEYSVKTASRAEELGIPVSGTMYRYSCDTYSDSLEANLASRQSLADVEWSGVYEELKSKTAEVSPEQFAQILAKVDQESGLMYHWDGKVVDPWLSTFGPSTEKVAAESWSWESPEGSTVNLALLTALAAKEETLKEHFDQPFVEAFAQDPVTIFESMPVTTKHIICNLAGEDLSGKEF